jgi:3-hydroxyisobutyrate dehydrogenase-like beta-hydroxyacid dehydrogenase
MMKELETINVGFIGLGAMGLPMASHLAAKLPKETRMYVFDVVQALVDKICSEHPDRVWSCSSSREVAEKTVRGMACFGRDKD